VLVGPFVQPEGDGIVEDVGSGLEVGVGLGGDDLVDLVGELGVEAELEMLARIPLRGACGDTTAASLSDGDDISLVVWCFVVIVCCSHGGDTFLI
jgi:hypothetical protein